MIDDIAKRQARRAPRTGNVEDIERHLRIREDEDDKRFRRLAERASDKYDELSFLSAGDDVEVRVPNTLGFIPNRGWTCCVRGPWMGYFSRADAGDENTLFLSTNAPEGERIHMRFERVRSTDG